MLSIPVFASISGVTIFRDDEDPSQFYYLPRSPRLAIGPGGKPEFTFLRYQFPIERPGPEPGGGYMVFTTVMTEDPQLLENNVKPVLQARLRAENPTATSIPSVTLAPADFTEGQVRLIIMQNNQFVKAVTLGKPSLFGDNSASVAVELSADAATLFYGALRGGGSVAAIEYDLTFPVRLPALTILGHVDSQEVKTAMMGRDVSTSTSGDTWGSESHQVSHRTSISETMNSMGMIHLEILKGSVALSQEDEDSLRAFAFKAMDDFVKDHFLKGGSVETEADRKSEWMSFIHDDIHERFDINVSYRDVIKRDYNPNAQINPSFLGVPIDQIIQDIDMSNAPWYFNNLEVTVDTNLDFTKYGDIIHSVVGNLSYDQSGPDGSRITHRDSVVFTADDNKPKTFKTRIIATKVDAGTHTSYRVQDTYHVDLEVNYKSGPTLQAVLQRLDTTTRHLTLDIPNPGVMEIAFAAEPNAFGDQLIGVEVDIDYADPEHSVPRATETVLLNKDKPTAHYRRVIYAPWTQPYRFRLTYNLKDADGNIQRSVNDWIEASSDTLNVNVPSPFDQAFSLNIVPSIDWDELRELAVDLTYDDDPTDYHATKSVYFTKDTDKVLQWRFLLRNPKNRSFRYRETWLYTNNASEVKDWKTQDRDGTLQVGDAPYGVAKVDVDPSDIDLGGQVKRVLVHLTYTDQANTTPDTAALLFSSPDKQTWSIRLGPKQRDYTYDATYFMKDNSRRQLTGQRGTIGSTHEFLVLPVAPSA